MKKILYLTITATALVACNSNGTKADGNSLDSIAAEDSAAVSMDDESRMLLKEKWEGLYAVSYEDDVCQSWVQIAIEMNDDNNGFNGRERSSESITATDVFVDFEAQEKDGNLVVKQKSGFDEMYFPSLGNDLDADAMREYKIEYEDGKYFLVGYYNSEDKSADRFELERKGMSQFQQTDDALNFEFYGSMDHFSCQMNFDKDKGECVFGKDVTDDGYVVVTEEGNLRDAVLEDGNLSLNLYDKKNTCIGSFNGKYSGLMYHGTYTDKKKVKHPFCLTRFFSLDDLPSHQL